MANCVMKYNKNNMYSGINIYNKLDKDIQEIIDNYLIQWRREENGDFYFEYEDNSYFDIRPIVYRRFITDYHLHYKFNNPIMEKIFYNSTYYCGGSMCDSLSIYDIIEQRLYLDKDYSEDSSSEDDYLPIFEELDSLYNESMIEKITDKLHTSTDFIITEMFRVFKIGYSDKQDIHNMDIFEKICKQMDRIPLEVINAVITFQNEVIGELDISTKDKLDFAKISVWFVIEYLRAEIYNLQE